MSHSFSRRTLTAAICALAAAAALAAGSAAVAAQDDHSVKQDTTTLDARGSAWRTN
jgi:hypothetical protein